MYAGSRFLVSIFLSVSFISSNSFAQLITGNLGQLLSSSNTAFNNVLVNMVGVSALPQKDQQYIKSIAQLLTVQINQLSTAQNNLASLISSSNMGASVTLQDYANAVSLTKAASAQLATTLSNTQLISTSILPSQVQSNNSVIDLSTAINSFSQIKEKFDTESESLLKQNTQILNEGSLTEVSAVTLSAEESSKKKAQLAIVSMIISDTYKLVSNLNKVIIEKVNLIKSPLQSERCEHAKSDNSNNRKNHIINQVHSSLDFLKRIFFLRSFLRNKYKLSIGTFSLSDLKFSRALLIIPKNTAKTILDELSPNDVAKLVLTPEQEKLVTDISLAAVIEQDGKDRNANLAFVVSQLLVADQREELLIKNNNFAMLSLYHTQRYQSTNEGKLKYAQNVCLMNLALTSEEKENQTKVVSEILKQSDKSETFNKFFAEFKCEQSEKVGVRKQSVQWVANNINPLVMQFSKQEAPRSQIANNLRAILQLFNL